MDTFSKRYGSISRIGARSRDLCHLCHEPVELSTYGLPRLYGRDTATVDHLIPQSFGGGDERENLMLAHHGCNAARGIRDPSEVRLVLAGTSRAPRSAVGQVAAVTGAAVAGGFIAGHLFSTTDELGNRQFNHDAALIGAILSAFLAA